MAATAIGSEVARQQYGVVLTEADEVDVEASAALRGRMRSERLEAAIRPKPRQTGTRLDRDAIEGAVEGGIDRRNRDGPRSGHARTVHELAR